VQEVKVCNGCKISKPASFYRKVKNGCQLGLYHICIDCSREYYRNYTLKRLDPEKERLRCKIKSALDRETLSDVYIKNKIRSSCPNLKSSEISQDQINKKREEIKKTREIKLRNKFLLKRKEKCCLKCNDIKSKSFFMVSRNICKQCQCEEQKIRYNNNPEKYKAIAKKYALENREELSKYKRDWLSKQPDYYREIYDKGNEKYKENNKDILYLSRYVYYFINRDRLIEKCRKWVKRNKNRRKEVANKHARKAMDELSDSYICSVIKGRHFKTSNKIIKQFPKLIELKRKHIKNKRLIKQKTHGK
jgi:hypothetical protein